MPKGPPVTLEFLGEQMERLLASRAMTSRSRSSKRSTVPAEIWSRRFRNAHHHGFCSLQLAVA